MTWCLICRKIWISILQAEGTELADSIAQEALQGVFPQTYEAFSLQVWTLEVNDIKAALSHTTVSPTGRSSCLILPRNQPSTSTTTKVGGVPQGWYSTISSYVPYKNDPVFF